MNPDPSQIYPAYTLFREALVLLPCSTATIFMTLVGNPCSTSHPPMQASPVALSADRHPFRACRGHIVLSSGCNEAGALCVRPRTDELRRLSQEYAVLTLPLAFCRVGLGLWCGGSKGLPRPLAAPPQLHGNSHTATAPTSTFGRHDRTGCHPSVALYCLYLSRIKMLIHQAAAI